MTKADIVEALRCAASECFRFDETRSFRMWGSSLTRASEHFCTSVNALEKAARSVGVAVIKVYSADAKAAALLEAAQRIEESE